MPIVIDLTKIPEGWSVTRYIEHLKMQENNELTEVNQTEMNQTRPILPKDAFPAPRISCTCHGVKAKDCKC